MGAIPPTISTRRHIAELRAELKSEAQLRIDVSNEIAALRKSTTPTWVLGLAVTNRRDDHPHGGRSQRELDRTTPLR